MALKNKFGNVLFKNTKFRILIDNRNVVGYNEHKYGPPCVINCYLSIALYTINKIHILYYDVDEVGIHYTYTII